MATMNAPTMDRRAMPERRASLHAHGRSVMSTLDYLAMALLIVGGLNWGMVGLFDVDMIATLFGANSPLSRVTYVLVGVAALYSVYTTAKMAGSRRH
jgi:uncharacterized membrane protein YuzA (DUF378 family)